MGRHCAFRMKAPMPGCGRCSWISPCRPWSPRRRPRRASRISCCRSIRRKAGIWSSPSGWTSARPARRVPPRPARRAMLRQRGKRRAGPRRRCSTAMRVSICPARGSPRCWRAHCPISHSWKCGAGSTGSRRPGCRGSSACSAATACCRPSSAWRAIPTSARARQRPLPIGRAPRTTHSPARSRARSCTSCASARSPTCTRCRRRLVTRRSMPRCCS